MDEQQPGNVISPNPPQEVVPGQEVSLQIPRDPMPEQNVVVQPVVIPQAQSMSSTAQPEQPVYQNSAPQPAVSAPPVEPVESAPAESLDTFTYTPDTVNQPAEQNAAAFLTAQDPVSWTASEFIDHAKSVNWYLMLGIVGLLTSVIVYFWTKDIISTAAIAVVAIIFGVSASRKPRVLPYEINEYGIQIDTKQYSYSEFKTFSIIRDAGPFSSIQLMPLKRFAAPVSMYFSPDDEESIANALSMYLPYEERKMDATDRLLHKIRF